MHASSVSLPDSVVASIRLRSQPARSPTSNPVAGGGRPPVRKSTNRTVVSHTIVWPYLPDAVRASAEAAIAAAPLALLSFESAKSDPSRTDLHLTQWPGGERRLLARSSHHPLSVHWL